MAIGTAGYTAMFAVKAIERDGSPGEGPVVVTGALAAPGRSHRTWPRI